VSTLDVAWALEHGFRDAAEAAGGVAWATGPVSAYRSALWFRPPPSSGDAVRLAVEWPAARLEFCTVRL
jgi:hypothetical protein